MLDRNDSVASVLRLLAPVSVEGFAKRRVGASNDGGFVMLDDLQPVGIAYSLGIGPDVSWDLDLAERGVDIYQYDHTVAETPVSHPRFQHFRIGIAHDDSLSPDLNRLDTILGRNGHAQRRDMVLKVDIEGHEWAALEVLDDAVFGQFRQIVLELHGMQLLDMETFRQRAHRLLSRLRQQFEVIHVHGNNFSGMAAPLGLGVPDCIEVTLVRTDLYRFVPSAGMFPGPLDLPNDSARPDLVLGSFQCGAPLPADGTAGAVPFARVLAESEEQAASKGVALPAYLVTSGQHEIERIAASYLPVTPPSTPFRVSEAWIDQAIGLTEGYRLADGAGVEYVGTGHLTWPAAIAHLQARMRDTAWYCLENDITAAAITRVAAFLHFHTTWNRHPLFPAMMASAVEAGLSMDGFAPFAAAHCLSMNGNRVYFRKPDGGASKIDRFDIATGSHGPATAHIACLDYRPGLRKTPRDTVGDRIAAACTRINPRHPGMVVLSAGAAPMELDSPVADGLRFALHNQARKNHGLMAVALLALRLLATGDRREMLLRYGFLPIQNQQFRHREPAA